MKQERGYSRYLYTLLFLFLAVAVVTITGSCGGGGGGGDGGGPSVPSVPTSVNLPETGQTTCYDATGTVIPCTSTTGQDGSLQKGVAWPSPRFTDNGNGTVTDNLTGLIWLKNANCFSTRTWAQALSNANSLASGSCGLTDGSSAGNWRLPNRKELRSLINYGPTNAATWLTGQGFSNVQADLYWSSSTYANNTTYAYDVDMFVGDVFPGSKASTRYMWPVRAGDGGVPADLPKTGQTTSYATGDDGDLEKGVAWPSPRFTIDGTGNCVTDNLTGLMWVRTPDSTTRTWATALTYANGLSRCGYTDWRLPNVNELESLINVGQANTATWLTGQGFINVQANFYWSSSTYANDPAYAWDVTMNDGYVYGDVKTNTGYVWPVRAGQ